jgi:ketosteroid isomerase-like protein
MFAKIRSNRSGHSKYFILALFLVSVLVITSCGKELTEEEKIEALIEDAAEKVEGKDVKGVLKYVSESYKDKEGGDRNQIKGMLFLYTRQYEKIGIYVRDTEIEVNGDDATAVVKLIFTGGENIVPDSGSSYVVDLKLKLEDGGWRVVRAGWTELGGAF